MQSGICAETEIVGCMEKTGHALRAVGVLRNVETIFPDTKREFLYRQSENWRTVWTGKESRKQKIAIKSFFLKQRKSFGKSVRGFFRLDPEPVRSAKNVLIRKLHADSRKKGFPQWKRMESWSVISVPKIR